MENVEKYVPYIQLFVAIIISLIGGILGGKRTAEQKLDGADINVMSSQMVDLKRDTIRAFNEINAMNAAGTNWGRSRFEDMERQISSIDKKIDDKIETSVNNVNRSIDQIHTDMGAIHIRLDNIFLKLNDK